MSGNRPSWSISRAATECGVSVSTIKRRLREGKFPDAVQGAGGAWTIPVQDLIGAGFTPGKPSTADPVKPLVQGASELVHRPDSEELLNRISDLEQDLKLERQKRESLENLLRERADHVESLKLAMRIIEPSQRPSSQVQPEPVSEPPLDTAPVVEPPLMEPAHEVPGVVETPRKRRWWQPNRLSPNPSG